MRDRLLMLAGLPTEKYALDVRELFGEEYENILNQKQKLMRFKKQQGQVELLVKSCAQRDAVRGELIYRWSDLKSKRLAFEAEHKSKIEEFSKTIQDALSRIKLHSDEITERRGEATTYSENKGGLQSQLDQLAAQAKEFQDFLEDIARAALREGKREIIRIGHLPSPISYLPTSICYLQSPISDRKLYNFFQPFFAISELSPGILHDRITIQHKQSEHNGLRNGQTIEPSKKFPIDAGTVPPPKLLTKTQIIIRRRRRQETLTKFGRPQTQIRGGSATCDLARFHYQRLNHGSAYLAKVNQPLCSLRSLWLNQFPVRPPDNYESAPGFINVAATVTCVKSPQTISVRNIPIDGRTINRADHPVISVHSCFPAFLIQSASICEICGFQLRKCCQFSAPVATLLPVLLPVRSLILNDVADVASFPTSYISMSVGDDVRRL